jgi:hypothetical protein
VRDTSQTPSLLSSRRATLSRVAVVELNSSRTTVWLEVCLFKEYTNRRQAQFRSDRQSPISGVSGLNARPSPLVTVLRPPTTMLIGWLGKDAGHNQNKVAMIVGY